jgi:hypothetical protein
MDIELLKQQLEFIRIELGESKDREAQQKNMYEIMLKSLIQNDSDQEISLLKSKHSNEIQKIKDNCNTQILKFQDANLNLNSLLESSKKELDWIKQHYQDQIKELLKEKSDMQLVLYENSDQIGKLVQEVNALKSQINVQAEKDHQSLLLIKSQLTEQINDLQRQHAQEKQVLEHKIQSQMIRIGKLCKGNVSYELDEILADYSLSLTVEALKSCDEIKAYLKHPEISSIDVLKVLHSILSLYTAFESNQESHLKPRESNYNSFYSVSLDLTTQTDQKKTNESEAELTPTSPLRPGHLRSQTLIPVEKTPYFQVCKENDEPDPNLKQVERMVSFASSMECELCKYLFPTYKFYEHLLSCMNQNTSYSICSVDIRPSFQKVEKMESQINQLKLTLGKLKNQRDRARINNDKLLVSLKKTKLELAVAEENAGQKQMDLKNEIKNLLRFIHTLQGITNFPSPFSNDLSTMTARISRYFGGKINLKSR